MGIFSGLFKSRDKPQNRTSGSNYAFFFGGTTSGKAVTERSAMQMTAVYSCVRILSEAVAGLPLHLYKYTDSGGKAMALDHPLYRLLHDEPNPEMSSFVFRETLMTHLLLWGNAYAQIIRNGKGEVVALYPLMPNRMEVNRDKNGKLYYLYSTQSDDAPTMKGSTVYALCRNCLAPLEQTPHKRKRMFCSDACRMAWWNAHPESVQRKAYYTLTCRHCGKQFESYGNSHRVFCSRDCYLKFRRKETDHE